MGKISHIFYFLLTVVIVLIITYPTITFVNTSVMGDGGDNFQYLSYQYITKSNISDFKHPFANSDIMRYPIGFDYSRSFDVVLGTIVGALLMFILSPVMAYNLSILFLLFLNIYISYLAFRLVTKDNLASYIGALVYGASFYVIGRSYGHPNLMFIAGLPVVLAGIHAVMNHNTLKSYVLFFAGILLLSLGSTQYVLYLLISGAFISILAFCFYADKVRRICVSIWLHPLPFMISLFVFIGIFLLLYFPYLNSLFFSKSFVFPNSKYQLFDLRPTFIDYLIPNSFLKLFLGSFITSSSPVKIEGAVFIGYIEMILFAFFLFSSRYSLRVRIFYLAAAISFIILPFLVYPFVYTVFPFSTTAEIGRYYVVAELFIAFPIVLYLAKQKKNIIFLVIIGLFVLLERFGLHYPLSSLKNYDRIFNAIKRDNSRSFVILPYDNWYSAYNLFPVFTDKKIANGYIHWSAETKNIKYNLANCEDPSRFDLNHEIRLSSNTQWDTEQTKNTYFISCLKRQGVGLIVYDKYYRVYWDGKENMLARTSHFFPRISEIQNTNDITIEASRWLYDKLNYSFYFPKSGYFNLKDIHYGSPTKNKNLTIRLNEEQIYKNLTYKNSFEWDKWTTYAYATEESQLYIPQGSTLTFNTEEYYTQQGFLNIEYGFSETNPSETALPQEYSLQKIYEDPQYELWHIN